MIRPDTLNGTAQHGPIRRLLDPIAVVSGRGKLTLGILRATLTLVTGAARDGQTGDASARRHDASGLQLAHVARDREAPRAHQILHEAVGGGGDTRPAGSGTARRSGGPPRRAPVAA